MKYTDYLFMILFLFQQVFILIVSGSTCTKSDIGILIGECNFNKIREIIFYWKNNCNPGTSLTLPSTKTNDECDFVCNSGEHISYNIKENKLICQKCQKGTYSTGGQRSIHDWNESILSEFINNCYAIINDDVKNNDSCEKFKILTNGTTTSLIAGQGKKIKDSMYSYELIYNLQIKQAGKVTFRYIKDTVFDYKYINGQINFYVDYDLKLNDNKIEKEVQEFSINLDVGHHSLMWQYNVWATPDNSNRKMEFQLFSIDFEGFHNHQYQCLPCNKDSNQFATCKECQENHYYDGNKKQCVKCADDEYSLPNASSANECVKQPNCNNDYVIEEHTGRCDSNDMDDVIYEYDGKLCLKDSGKRIRVLQEKSQKNPLEPDPSGDEPPDFSLAHKNPQPKPGSGTATIKKPTKGKAKSPVETVLPSTSSNIKINSSEDNSNEKGSQSNILTSQTNQDSSSIKNPHQSKLDETNPNSKWEFPTNKKEKCKPCNEGYKKVSSEGVFICEACGENSYLDPQKNTCVDCQKGTELIKKLTITGHSVHAREFFESNICNNITDVPFENKACPGWVFRSHGIHSGISVPSYTQKVLSKKVKVVANTGKLYINFTVHDLQYEQQEEFMIKVNDKYSDFSKERNKNYSIEYTLENGENEILFIFNKNSDSSKFNNQEEKYSVIIQSIVIIGSNEGAGISCSDCSDDAIQQNLDGKKICLSCGKGTIPNKDKTKCIECTVSDTVTSCLNCPKFTRTTKSGDCNLKNIIHNKKALIKYNLKEFTKEINSECEGHNEICYNTFLGPIRDHSKGDIFFLSFSMRNLINVSDFTYMTSEHFIDKGHVFALFHSNTIKKENNVENFKLLKNIGNYISDVKLIQDPNINLKDEIKKKNQTQIFNKSGIMIEYGLGEYCLEKEKYKSYLFLYCSKLSNNHAPRLVKKSTNGCTLYFEMYSNQVCPICVKSQIQIQSTTCRNNKKTLIFNENDNCIIKNYNKEKDQEEDNFYGELDNILTFNDTISNPDLSYYFNIDKNNNDYSDIPTYIEISDDKLNLPDEAFYAVDGMNSEEICSMADNFDSSYLYLFMFIPLLYFATGICVIVFYCKYKRATYAYERLREERPNESNIQNHSSAEIDNQLELEVIN